MFFAGKPAIFNIADIFPESPPHFLGEVSVFFNELRGKDLENSQHVIDNEYLTIAVWPGANAQSRNFQIFRDEFTYLRRDTLQ